MFFRDYYLRARAGEEVKFPYADYPLAPDFTPMVPMNRVFREHGHLYAYDAQTMCALLLQAKFKEPGKTKFMEGRDPQLLVDSPSREIESLYVEATA